MTPTRIVLGAGVAAWACLTLSAQRESARGIQDPAWAPDGRRLAFSFLDRIWISAPDGRNGRPLRPDSAATERDPAWSPDGRFIAFSADEGRGFDIYIAPVDGGLTRRVTASAEDERWPAWTRDGRLIFSRRDGWRYRLLAVAASGHSTELRASPSTELRAGGDPSPLFSDSADDEREARVAPDGKRIAYVSDRDSEDGDVDLWVADLATAGAIARPRRILRARGREAFPSWSPEGDRIAFYGVREGVGSVWVTPAESAADPPTAGRLRPAEPAVLVSRRGGAPAWSPDGRHIVIADLPPPDPAYNGNPLRSSAEPPPLFDRAAFRLWTVDAPRPVDSGARAFATTPPPPRQLLAAFDRVWKTLQDLYYSSGDSADEWRRLKEKYRPEATAARDEAALERVLDRLVADQPLIKRPVTSSRAIVVSGHPLASRAGAMAFERSGNIVDAAVAVSFALGVVEPEASGIGGDGMAVLYLNGMTEPVVIDYKDQTPIRATRDIARSQQNTGDGPVAANIPGVVAGLELLYRRYGSKKIPWRELIAPAIEYAEEGFALDETLPTSIAEGRRLFEKHPAAARIYLPAGKVPRPGDSFVNKDYAATLRAIATEGAQTFYRGSIARRIVDDMARNGGLITQDDLAQYRAIERRPLVGRYRDHIVYSSPPPVSTGLSLIETLQILESYHPRPGASPASDADYFHYAIEAWKVRDQPGRIADPAFWDVDVAPHLDPAHAAMLFKRIDPQKASPYRIEPQGRGAAATERVEEPVPERIGRGTTAFVVADADGNIIAVTQTLSTWGGTFYVSEGLGFLYNNHLRLAGGGPPGRFLPLARSTSTSVPTLVFKAAEANSPGVPRLAVAAAGNAWIPASVYTIILNVVDGGVPAQNAIEAPRFLIGRDVNEPDAARMQIEDRIPRWILEDLEARGHRFQKIGRKGELRYGYAAAALVDPERRQVQGGADPRRSHSAATPR